MNRLLPPNQTPFEASFARAILGSELPNGIDWLWSPDFCPVDFLPFLAWGLSVDAWNENQTLPQKRRAITLAPEIHRAKGTLKAVKDTVASFGGAIILKEWWETTPKGTPGTFDLFLSIPNLATSPNTNFINSVIDAVRAVIPISAHFNFTLSQSGFAKVAPIIAGRRIEFKRQSFVLSAFFAAAETYFIDSNGRYFSDIAGNLLIEG